MEGIKAVILAGGEGTRLRPLTSSIPKPMVPVVNRPFLEHMIDLLKAHQVTDIILTLCYLPDLIRRHFGDGSDFGVRLTYVVEDCPLGTAGAVKNVEEHLSDTFLVINGDVFTDLDLSAMIALHREKGAVATIALTPVDNPTNYGVVETDYRGRVRRFIEKPSWDVVTTNMINAGFYLLGKEALQHIPQGSYFMFERGLFPLLLRLGAPFYSYASRGYWIDIGTPEHYLQLNRDLILGRKGPPPGQKMANGIYLGEGCNIHPLAQIAGPVVLGKGCTIGRGVRLTGPVAMGDGCSVRDDTIIEGVVLWRGVKVGERVTMRNCIVGDNALIGDGVWVTEGAILGDSVIVGSGNRLSHGMRVWPGKALPPESVSF